MTSKNTVRPRLDRSLLTCALASCLVLVAPQTYAQSANATLRGQIDGAAAGTEVTATNAATGAVRRTQATANGGYTLSGLEPGTYTVQAGPGPAQTVRLSVASTATLNLKAGQGEAPTAGATDLDTVTVTAPALLQEVKTSEVGKTISLRQIQTVPQVSRNFLEFADAVPGVVFTRTQNGATSLRGGAQNDNAVNVYIDGVGQKSYVNTGGITGQKASPGNPFPQLAIGEYKVITSNYKAEYGQISSAAVTAVTKSGTNEFHGDAFFRYTDEDMRARRVDEKQPGADQVASMEKEYGFALGGPIIQDRLHFFVTYEAKRFDLPATIVADGVAANGVPFLPPDVAAQFGPVSKPFEQDLYFAKLDWQLGDNDHVAVSGQYRDETLLDGVGGVRSPSYGYDVINTDKRFNARWEHSGDRFFNEVLATTEDSQYAPTALNFGNGFTYAYNPPLTSDRPTIIQVGAADPRDTRNKGQKGWSIEDNLTFNDFQWHGDHVVKMGARYKDIDLYASDSINDSPQFFYKVTEDGTAETPYQAVFPKPLELAGVLRSVTSNAKQYGLYLQDDWSVNDHLVLNLGIRWDYEKTPSYLNFVTPVEVVNAFNSQDPNAPAGQTYAQSLAKGGLDVNDYISTGNNRKAFKDAWAPRLGFSYDLNADEQHVFHGGLGRSYDRDLYDYLQLEVTKLALSQPTIYFREGDTGTCFNSNVPCFDWDPNFLNGVENLQSLVAGSTAGAEVDLLNNNLKAPYSDQFSIGMSNQVGEWLTDATISRVLSHDGFAFTLGNRYPNGNFFDDPVLCNPSATPGGNGQPWGCPPPGFGSLLVGNNGIETRTTQVLLSAQKPFTKESGWGSTFSYTYTDAKQNRQIGEYYAFDGATIGDYPFIRSDAASVHRFVATGSLDGPWGIVFGGKLTLSTPLPKNDFLCNTPSTPNTGTCIPAAVEPGGNGKFLVGGKIWGFRDIDLQATKTFELGESLSMYARLDLLNVFNWENYSNYNVTNQGRLVASYNETGEIVFVPRTVKFEVGLKF